MGHIVAVAAFTLLAAGALATTPALASSACPNEQVRQESNTNPATGKPYSAGLPECRAYEMVSPLEKQAHNATMGDNGPLVSPAGDAVGYISEGAFAGTEGYIANGFAGPYLTYIARRTAAGWVTEPALPPASVLNAPTLWGFDGDASLDLSTLATCGKVRDSTEASGGSPNFACAIRDPGGTWTRTPTYTDLNGVTPATPVFLWGSSSDLSTIVWEPGSAVPLLPGDEVTSGQDGAIYETTGLGSASPQLRIVSVNNEGTPLTTEGGGNGPCLGAARATNLAVAGSDYQAISSDGNTIYFSAESSEASCSNSTLYARTGDFAGGTPASPTTVKIASDATFKGASPDGSKVFFTTTEQLAATDKDSTSDLYMYDFERPPGHQFVQVSAGGLGDPTPGEGANVEAEAVNAISSDGSHVYFSSPAVLATLPNGDGQHASNGSANLYGYDTETEQTQFVGEIDHPSCSISHHSCDTPQVTPDGRYLVFATTTHPSPDDTNGGAGVYRYDFQTTELTWVSHAAPGFTATDEGYAATLPERGAEQERAMAFHEGARRAISENGEYIIFTTAEKLQANDVNGAPDIYEWHNGTVSLISDGQNPGGIFTGTSGEIEGAGISASGADIFFATTTRLVGQDTDNLQDIYDARVGGGFPYTAPNPCTSGEACQGASSGPPAFGASGTATFTSGGNLTPGSTSFPPPEETKVKPLTRAQKLAKAVKQCKKDKNKKKRTSCEKEARKKYGTRAKK
jgi:Tol biopolymer transport system component